MRRILVLNSKGGCGKTTLATNLASYYASREVPVALFDYDPQGSCTMWLRQRSQLQFPIYGVEAHKTATSGVTRAFQLRIPAETQRVIVDAPAGIRKDDLNKYIAQVDTVLIPVQPSPIDIHAAARFIQELLLVGKIRTFNIRVGVVANRVKANTLVFRSLQRFLDSLNLPFITQLRDTQNYVHAAAQGVGMFELAGRPSEVDCQQWYPLIDWVEKRQGDVVDLATRKKIIHAG